MQYVSSTPATRLDVINLQEQLDQRLLQRQARETGICPVREELYAQCFDELIRQVTINCAERGLLLLRVRDEIRMTIAAYQTLYESSIAFGMRKALQAEQGKADMEARIKQLEAEKKDLERQVQELKAKAEAIEKREGERRALEEKKHAEEVQFLKCVSPPAVAPPHETLPKPTCAECSGWPHPGAPTRSSRRSSRPTSSPPRSRRAASGHAFCFCLRPRIWIQVCHVALFVPLARAFMANITSGRYFGFKNE